MPIGYRQASCASQQQSLDSVNLTPCLLNVESFLISSDLISSQLLLEIAHCISLSPQSVSSHLISSSQLIRCLLGFFHLISSNPISCLLPLSQLFSANHNCSHRFSCHLSFSHLFSSHLGLSQLFLRLSQLVSTLFSSPQLLSTHLVPSHLFPPPLTSSKLFSHFLS